MTATMFPDLTVRPIGAKSLIVADAGVVKAADPDWKQLHRIADRLRPDLQRTLFDALDTLKKQIPTASLVDLIEGGQLDQVLAAVKLELPDLTALRDVIGTIAGQSGRVAAVGLNMRFDLVNERAVRWAGEYGSQLITEVNRETQQAVAEIVQRGFLEGQAPRVQALAIEQVVGLHSRDAGAVTRYLSGLVESGVSERRAADLAGTYSKRLLRKRAELIARTETMRASNMGQQLAWDAAADTGLLIREETRKVWIVTDDDRTCSRCMSLEDATVPLDGSFTEKPKEDRPKVDSPPSKRLKPKPSKRDLAQTSATDTRLIEPGQFKDALDAENWLKAQGIQDVNLKEIARPESLNDIGRAVKDVQERYPWMADKFGTNQGLNSVVTNTDRLAHFGAGADVRMTSQGVQMSLRPDVFNDSMIFDIMSAGDHSAYSTVMHEMGHVAQMTLEPRARALEPFRAYSTSGGPWSGLGNGHRKFLSEVSMYADENGNEYFAELFGIKNTGGYAAHLDDRYWKREGFPASALKRLEAAERQIEENWAGWAEHHGINPEDLL